MNLEQIARIAELMSQHDLTEFLLECDEMKLSLKRGSSERLTGVGQVPLVVAAPAMVAPGGAGPTAAAGTAAAAGAGDLKPGRVTIDAPIVGTFYLAPAPGAASFVKAGDEVNVNTVVCIVEAMKVMNEIKAEVHGVVEKVLVENGTPVEFGQPLFEIRPL